MSRTSAVAGSSKRICDNLLLTSFALESRLSSIEMLDEVCDDMRLEWPGKRRRQVQTSDDPFRQPPLLQREFPGTIE